MTDRQVERPLDEVYDVQRDVEQDPCGALMAIHRLAADSEALRQRAETAERTNAQWQQNSRDTWEAMQAMRNSINEHVPMPSIEGDLLQGPENSIFCAAVAEAVMSALTEARAQLDAEWNAAIEAAAIAAETTPDELVGTMELTPSQYVVADAIRAIRRPAKTAGGDA